MPCYIEERDDFRQYLTLNRVFCPVHWPLNETKSDISKNAKWISNHVISFPIDQRYSEKDIMYMAEVINAYPHLNN
jgi:dTDP-4-amino-4,6-dideoxygalactose transaminase